MFTQSKKFPYRISMHLDLLQSYFSCTTELNILSKSSGDFRTFLLVASETFSAFFFQSLALVIKYPARI